jgi:hypothetical protein
MIKGLAITPPVIGRISIGKLVNRNDKWLPEKDDSFTLTTQVQTRDGWLLHPLHQPLVDASTNGKIRAIPIKLLFNDSDLNLRSEYSAFDRKTGRPLCVGNGEQAKRVSDEGLQTVACDGPEHCPFAKANACKLYGRFNLQVEGQNDELGSFIFRTTGYNSVRTLAARLKYFEAICGGHTRHLPLLLRLRAKSTTQSRRSPVYYVDLTLREEHILAEAVAMAREEARHWRDIGIDSEQMENAARQLLANGQFEDSEEEVPQLLEEFYPENESHSATSTPIRHSRLTPQLGSTTTQAVA